MRSVSEALKRELTRRRALLITPFAFGGLVAITSRRAEDRGDERAPAANGNSEVEIVLFGDSGERLGSRRVAKLVRSNTEWRRRLSVEQYYVARQKGTDTAFTGTYYQLHQPGLFRCICCASAVFSSDAKFDSETGWPSFTAPIAPENIYTRTDMSMLIERTEALCTRCDAHLGHLFMDGPEPTYCRYCINESSLNFIPRNVKNTMLFDGTMRDQRKPHHGGLNG